MNYGISCRPSRLSCAAAALLACMMVGGCTSTADDPSSGAVNSGNYPNLNIKPQVATDQLSPEERAAKTSAVKGAQTASVNSGGTPPADEQAQLSELAGTHAQKTLDEIEKKDCSPRPSCN